MDAVDGSWFGNKTTGLMGPLRIEGGGSDGLTLTTNRQQSARGKKEGG
jgi:hypothetical protein